MKDLKIEYHDGKLIELVIDGEQQDASTMNSISFSHKAGGIPQLQVGRGYHFYPKHKAVGSESMLEIVEKWNHFICNYHQMRINLIKARGGSNLQTLCPK